MVIENANNADNGGPPPPDVPIVAAPNVSAVFGTMQPFNHETDQWRIYKGRLAQFFNTIGLIDEERKKSALLNYVGASTYRLLFDLCSPIDPGAKTYKDLCDMMEEHFTPPVVIFRERKEFYVTTRRSDESVQDWLVRIRAIASNCRFGDRLDALLLDKFITGQSGRGYDRLCEGDETITLKRATELSLKYDKKPSAEKKSSEEVNFVRKKHHPSSSESTKNNMASNHRNGNNSSNSKFPSSSSSSPASSANKSIAAGRKCDHCGYTSHLSDQCRYKRATCKKIGHLASVCRSTNRANFMTDEASLSSSTFECVNNIISPSSVKPITIDVIIENTQHTFQFDSGSAISAVSVSDFNSKFRNFKLCNDSTVLRGYGNELIHVVGAIFPTISFNNVKNKFKILVIENGGPPILGRNFLAEFKLKEIKICKLCRRS